MPTFFQHRSQGETHYFSQWAAAANCFRHYRAFPECIKHIVQIPLSTARIKITTTNFIAAQGFLTVAKICIYSKSFLAIDSAGISSSINFFNIEPTYTFKSNPHSIWTSEFVKFRNKCDCKWFQFPTVDFQIPLGIVIYLFIFFFFTGSASSYIYWYHSTEVRSTETIL